MFRSHTFLKRTYASGHPIAVRARQISRHNAANNFHVSGHALANEHGHHKTTDGNVKDVPGANSNKRRYDEHRQQGTGGSLRGFLAGIGVLGVIWGLEYGTEVKRVEHRGAQ